MAMQAYISSLALPIAGKNGQTLGRMISYRDENQEGRRLVYNIGDTSVRMWTCNFLVLLRLTNFNLRKKL